jgi:IPT/TIG domain
MQVLGMTARPFGALLLASSLWLAACGSNDGKLKVTNLTPSSGDAMGGQILAITGQGFMKTTRTAKVYFGDQPGNVIRFKSDSEMIVEAPGGKPDQTVDVLVVFEPGGEITIPKAYTFREKKSLDAQDLKTK